MNRSNSPPQPDQWDNSNSILPDNTAQAYSNHGVQDSFQVHSASTEKLNGEQLDWLIKRLSTDDQKELSKILRECTTEMTLTRGLPFAAVVTGGMYFARSRLPENMRFGPKRWPFYALIAIGSMTAANVLSMNNCGQRIKPKLNELYQKYTANEPNMATTYESLRAANRQHISPTAPQQYGIPPIGHQQLPPPISDPRATNYPSQPPRQSGYLYEDAPTISGTPISSGQQQKPGSSGYGDKDFS